MVLTMQTILAEGHAITVNRPYINTSFETREYTFRSPLLTQFLSEYFWKHYTMHFILSNMNQCKR